MAQRFELSETVSKAKQGYLSFAAAASVTVKDLSGNNLTVYSAETGSSTVSNPVTADAFGRIEGWVEAPDFDLAVSGTGITSYTQKVRQSPAGHYHVKSYGAVPDGVANATPAITAAIAAAGVDGIVDFRGGVFLTDELDQVHDGQFWLMEGTTLKARSNSIKLIHWSASDGGILGYPSLDGNGKTGVSLLRITPQDEAQTTTVVQQNRNRFEIHEVGGATNNGVVMACGPRVAGTDSNCFKNEIVVHHVYNCERGLWLKSPTTNPGAGVNDNDFYGFKVISFSGGLGNTGIQIDAGSQNRFYGPSAENMMNATSPNATPTGVKIAATGGGGADNNENWIFGYRCEGNTRDWENANARTYLFGHTIDPAKRVNTANPAVEIGPDGPGGAAALKIGSALLYNPSADVLQSPDSIRSTEPIYANVGEAGQIGLGDLGLPVVNFSSTAAAGVGNNSLFRDSADNKLKYKDNAGVVNALY